MIHIALIEDNLHLLEALGREIASEADFRLALAVTSAEEALEFQGWDDLTVALVDIQLPGASGLDLIRSLQRLHPQLRIIVCSAREGRETVFAALKAGATGYLLKREMESDPGVCTLIRQMLSGGTPISPSVARWILEDFLSRRSTPENPALSPREMEILRLLEQGLLYKEIATALSLSDHTIHAHAKNIYAKLQAKGRNDALVRARDLGYLGGSDFICEI